MNKRLLVIFLAFMFLLQVSCNNQKQLQRPQQQSQQQSKKTILSQCKRLGEESIVYARANYVKLFYEFNPDKFLDSYSQVKDFNYKTHRSAINSYEVEVRKLKVKDPISKSFLQSCKELSEFSQNLVDQSYPRAISFKMNSKLSPLSDEFFLEINKIIKFDHNIGQYKKKFISFKEHVKNYKMALKKYVETYKSEISE